MSLPWKNFDKNLQWEWERAQERSPFDYHPSELEEVEKVHKAFGALYLKEGKKDEKELPRPWSGYWYPFRSGEMFTGSQSPLAKLDSMLKNLGKASRIQATDAELYASFPSDTWEGLCDSWAYASLSTVEPKRAVQYGGVVFSISDQKALATRLHQGTPNNQYGTLYRGTVETDGTYQDLRPEAFHQVMVSTIKAGNYFVIDDDAGIEVWSKPAYHFRYEVKKDPQRKDAYLVRTWLQVVSERKQETDLPTVLDDTAMKMYDYRLYFNREDESAEGYRIVAGEWLDDSFRSHPDAVFVPRISEIPVTKNTDLNRYRDEVMKILQAGTQR